MFSSALEASKFEGATIKTTSGIRGQIKKALRNTSVPAGSVRATFEDKIVPSDMVFLKSWYAVEVPKFYAPITNLLDQSFTSDNWIGLKTLGELKYINNIRVMPNENSLYKPITREEKVFAPLKIHKKLEEKLPFKFINKSDAVLDDPIAKQRVAVIREPKEAKVFFSFIILKHFGFYISVEFLNIKDGLDHENVQKSTRKPSQTQTRTTSKANKQA